MTGESEVKCVKLTSQSIIEILSGFNVKVTAQDLKGQNLEKIIEIYKGLLKTCLNLDETAIETFTYEIMSNFSDEVLNYQKNTFKRIQLYGLIYFLYEMSGMKPNISHIFFPSVHGKNVFNKQLSTLINFARFEYIQLEDFSALQQEFNVKSKQIAEIQNQCSWHKSQISMLRQDKAEKRIPIENTKKRIAMMNEKLAQIRTHNSRVDEEIGKYDKEIENITAENEKTQNTISNNQKRIQFLEKLLIKSPEKLEKDIEKNKIKIADTKALLQRKREENDSLGFLYGEREKAIDGFKFVMEALENFYLNDLENANKLMKEIEENKEEKINLEFENEQLESVIKTQARDKEKRKNDYEMYCELIEKEMVALNVKDQNYEAQKNAIYARMKALENSVTEMRSEKKAMIEQFNVYMEREASAIENLQRQREGVEYKRRILEEVHNHLRSNLAKQIERELASSVSEDEGWNEFFQNLKL